MWTGLGQRIDLHSEFEAGNGVVRGEFLFDKVMQTCWGGIVYDVEGGRLVRVRHLENEKHGGATTSRWL